MTDIDKATVRGYLEAQSRPWSVSGIVLNLHKAVGKTVVEQVLEQLSKGDDSPIVEGVNGKAKIYYARQVGDVSEEEVKAVSEEIEKMKRAKAELVEENAALWKREKELSAEPTDKELAVACAAEQKATHELRQRLAEVKKVAGSVSPKKLKGLKESHAKMVQLWRKRKRMCDDIVDQVLEGGGSKKPRELREEMGIETDADAGVDIKDFA